MHSLGTAHAGTAQYQRGKKCCWSLLLTQGGHKSNQILSPTEDSRTWITHLTCLPEAETVTSHPKPWDHLLCQDAAGEEEYLELQ